MYIMHYYYYVSDFFCMNEMYIIYKTTTSRRRIKVVVQTQRRFLCEDLLSGKYPRGKLGKRMRRGTSPPPPPPLETLNKPTDRTFLSLGKIRSRLYTYIGFIVIAYALVFFSLLQVCTFYCAFTRSKQSCDLFSTRDGDLGEKAKEFMYL